MSGGGEKTLELISNNWTEQSEKPTKAGADTEFLRLGEKVLQERLHTKVDAQNYTWMTEAETLPALLNWTKAPEVRKVQINDAKPHCGARTSISRLAINH